MKPASQTRLPGAVADVLSGARLVFVSAFVEGAGTTDVFEPCGPGSAAEAPACCGRLNCQAMTAAMPSTAHTHNTVCFFMLTIGLNGGCKNRNRRGWLLSNRPAKVIEAKLLPAHGIASPHLGERRRRAWNARLEMFRRGGCKLRTAAGKDGVADGIRTRNNKLHKLGLYH